LKLVDNAEKIFVVAVRWERRAKIAAKVTMTLMRAKMLKG